MSVSVAESCVDYTVEDFTAAGALYLALNGAGAPATGLNARRRRGLGAGDPSAPSSPSRQSSSKRGRQSLLAMVRSYVLRSAAVASRDVSRSEPPSRNFARDTAVDSHCNVVVRTCAQRPPRRSSAADSSATRAASRRRSSMAARPSSSAIGVCISVATSSNLDHRFLPAARIGLGTRQRDHGCVCPTLAPHERSFARPTVFSRSPPELTDDGNQPSAQ